MYVCICNKVTDKAIRQAADNGVRNLPELTQRTGCASSCGNCADFARQLLAEAQPQSRSRFPFAVLAEAA